LVSEHKHSPLRLLFYFFIHLCSVRIKTHSLLLFSCLCPLCTKISFFCAQGFIFALLFYFSFIYVLFVLKHTQFDMSLLFSELVHTQQEVKLFGPAFSSPAIWSVIFQILYFPGLAFLVAPHTVHHSTHINAQRVRSKTNAY